MRLWVLGLKRQILFGEADESDPVGNRGNNQRDAEFPCIGHVVGIHDGHRVETGIHGDVIEEGHRTDADGSGDGLGSE